MLGLGHVERRVLSESNKGGERELKVEVEVVRLNISSERRMVK